MLIARVDGNAVSTIRHPSLFGWRQLICQPLDEQGGDSGLPILAIDDLGAGLHQRVLISSDGKAVQKKVGTTKTPLRYMTIAVLDEVTEEVPA